MATAANLCWVALFFLLLIVPNFFARASDEVKILLTFKNDLVDELGNLGSWQEADTSPCQWTGVTCNDKSSVTVVDLSSKNISGSITSSVCSLPNLNALFLRDNFFNQTFPLGLLACTNLILLDLSENYFWGPVPNSISMLSKLEYLSLEYTNLGGPLPAGIGKLSELWYLSVWASLFTEIPPELGNLTKLTNLSLSYNPYTYGLPADLRKLKNLQALKCGGCGLTGPIPTWLGDLKQLDFLELTYNSLNGTIPKEFMYLPKLRQLELYSNLLTGPIPDEIGNLKSLEDIDLNSNFLTGHIPPGLAELHNLGLIHLWNNSLSGEIPPGIANLTRLYDVTLFSNKLSGSLPDHLGDNCVLEIFDVSTNELSGEVPPNLCNGGELKKLILFSNKFTGSIPDSYGSCSSLIRVRISDNNFTGSLPKGIWGLPNMTILEIHNNLLNGSITSDIGNAQSLQSLRVYNNKLSGILPAQIGQVQNLGLFLASQNSFSGGIPPELGNCSSLEKLYLDSNSLGGPIPSQLGQLNRMLDLDFAHNQLSGQIPPSLANMAQLVFLDLSDNQLSGKVPAEFGRFDLQYFLVFNLSYNDLSGGLPSSWSSTTFNFSVVGNPKLCTSDQLHCSTETLNHARKKPGLMAWITGAVLTTAVILSLVGSFCFFRRYRKFSKDDEYPQGTWMLTPFQKINFNEDDILESLDEDNVIGSGGAGKVYKASVKGGHYVAVKKLWSVTKGESNHDFGFRAEIETLGRIRHMNIVKLLCCCSNGETNLLVYDYIPNGSLGDLLHSTKGGTLDWATRHKIALGAAHGLSYLHHDCFPQILHRDIKSNNILLSDNYDALLSDFGLARLLEASSSSSSMLYSISTLAGSHGYIAPEYAHRMKVNEKSDVYSFGVVLLELVTGKRPVETEFGDGVDVVKWVCAQIETKETVYKVLDSRIAGSKQQDMLLVLKIALQCTSILPPNRPSMREVVHMLQEADPNHTSKDVKDTKPLLDASSVVKSVL